MDVDFSDWNREAGDGGDFEAPVAVSEPKPHAGSYSRYTNEGCRCDACRRANTEAHRAWRKAQKRVTA